MTNSIFFCLYLPQIRFDKRFQGDLGNDCVLSVDGTDFRIQQPKIWSKGWFSHKFNGPGLRYEVGVSILNGDICWINGPYEPGDWPDIKIFRNSLMSHLDNNERVEADDGYVGEAPQHVKCPMSFTNPEDTLKIQSRVRARHETVNKRFKQWGCLQQVFRHDLHRHADVFRACAVITQIALELGEPLFEVDYVDNHP